MVTNGSWMRKIHLRDGFGFNLIPMPKYILPQPGYDATIPHGTLHDTIIYSEKLANRRTVRVYLPPGYRKSTDKYPVILFHDGLIITISLSTICWD